MIEIEKKFILSEEEKGRLLENAEFLGEKAFTDTYYDNGSYELTLKDIWLRRRGDNFELKIPTQQKQEIRIVDRYYELETEPEIATQLGLSVADQTLSDVLEKSGYKEFCTVTTTRKKYRKDDFGIDLDEVDFGYTIAEIERMVEDESEGEKATREIIAYAKRYNLSDRKARGKVAEFLKRNSPEHFEALVQAGVVS